MAKKVTFNQSDLINGENFIPAPNQEMIDAMEAARAEIRKEESAAKTNSEETSTNKKKTTKTNKKKMSNLEIIQQNEENNHKPEFMSSMHDIVNNMKAQVNDILPNMNIDLNNIIISDSLNTMEKHTNLDLVFNSKPTFQVPLPQSCYTAYVDALNYEDIDSIKNSTLDEYHTTLQLYQTVHRRIQATTIGGIDFNTFIQCTSFFDLQNLFYGLHMQTFPGNTSFNFTCGECDFEFSKDIPNDLLFATRDEKVFERFDEISRNADSPEKVMAGSLLTKTKRTCLTQSKTIIDIRIPSLKDQLDILKSIPANQVKELANHLSTILFIKNIYLLNVPETLQKKTPVYYKVEGIKDQIEVVKMLSLSDAKQFSKETNDWINIYKTEYKIPDFNCPKCNHKLTNLVIDMEHVLFRQMLSQ